jgi:hypothetical protein
MKAHELRIGNFVHHNNEWCYRRPGDSNDPAISINEFDFQWEDRDWYALGESCIFFENISAIKLTAEWLTNWGFRNSEMNPRLFLGKGLTIFIDSDDDFMIGKTRGHGDTVGLCHLKYVHQLQNLYFSLTGIELEIKP